jgi:hypothetical protein
VYKAESQSATSIIRVTRTPREYVKCGFLRVFLTFMKDLKFKEFVASAFSSQNLNESFVMVEHNTQLGLQIWC